MVILLGFFLFSKTKNAALGFVVTSPEAAEILCAIGAEGRIVAVTAECDYPPSLQQLPKVGSFSQISIEEVLGYNPKLVFATVPTQQAFIHDLAKLGVQTETVYMRTFDDLLRTIDRFGTLSDLESDASALSARLRTTIEQYTLAPDYRPWVYVEIGDHFWTASDNTFLGDMIRHAGGRVLFHDLPNDYGKASQEEVAARNPDVIFVTYPGVSTSDVRSRRGWQDITACKENRIITLEDIDADIVNRATPRSVDALRVLGELLHKVPVHDVE